GWLPGPRETSLSAWPHTPFGPASLAALRYAADFGAHLSQSFFNAFVAAVNVIDAVDQRFALRSQAGQDERSAGPKVGGLYLGSAQAGLAPHHGAAAIHGDIRAHPQEFKRVEESVLKDGF